MTLKIVLLFPPPGNASQPYTSLPSLAAFMRRAGYTVAQHDLGICTVQDLLSRGRLTLAAERVRQRLDQLGRSQADEAEREALECVTSSAGYVCQHIDQAKQALRSPTEFYDYGRLTWALNLIKRGRELLSAEYYPTAWTATHLGMPGYTWAAQDILAATADEKQNIFLAYFRDTVMPQIADEQADLIGISITYSGQIIPGLTLARLLKERHPETHICLGGAVLARMQCELQRNPAVFDVADSIVIGEGEHALLGLARALETGGDWSAAPNLLYREHGQVRTTQRHVEDVNDLPTPDYAGLPLSLYLTPQLTALLPTERGCYWRRCAFCGISAGMYTYRPRQLELVLQDMQRLSQQLQTGCFFLSTDAMPVSRMSALAKAISAAGLDFTWQTEARLEKSLTPEMCRTLAEGGCRRLLLGLESGAQRVLDLMDKGITVEQAAQAIRNSHAAGIANHLFFIVGFPGETRQEARATLDFIHEHHTAIQSLNYVPFELNCDSKVYRDPQHYGIRSIQLPPPDWLNGTVYEYEVSEGMTPPEVAAQAFPEGTRDLEPLFSRAEFVQYASWALLNYLAHYGVRRLDDLPIPEPAPSSEHVLELVTVPASGLLLRRLNERSVVVFNPNDGNAAIVPAQVAALLSLCDGRETVRQIASRLASQSEMGDFVKHYYASLQLCQNLIGAGFLREAWPEAASGVMT